MNPRIYLDNNATTAVDPRVIASLIQATQEIGNPSSVHRFGQDIKSHLFAARQSIASYLQVDPSEVIFGSGATELLNLIIFGIVNPISKGHIISTTVEHSAVYQPLQYLERMGCPVTFVSVNNYGAPSIGSIQSALRSDTKLIVLMSVNNETGVKTDIDSIAAWASQQGIPLVIDGVAHLGKEDILLPKGVSAACFSGHKFHAPKGIGFAVIRSHLRLSPVLFGGGQEKGIRPGTENVPSIIAMATAIDIIKTELPSANKRMAELRDHFEKMIFDNLDGICINGEAERICNTSNLSFDGVDGEELLMRLDMNGIAASHGSACSSGALEPSRVLLNMGLSRSRAKSALRFSLSRMTTRFDIEHAAEIIIQCVRRLREFSPRR